MTKRKPGAKPRSAPIPATPLQLARFGHVAATIRKAMDARQWGPADLNQALGYERGNAVVYHWLNGKGAPLPKNAERIAKVLQVKVDDLAPRDVPASTLAAAEPVRSVAPPMPAVAAPRGREVLGFSVDDAGHARIKLDVALPVADAAPLLRMLLDAGFVIGARPDE